MLEGAPPAVQVAILSLLVSLKTSFDVLVQRPTFPDPEKTMTTWEELLVGLTDIRLDFDRLKSSRLNRLRHYSPYYIELEHRFNLLKRAHEQNTLMIEILYDLIAAGQEFKTAEEVLERSGEVLLRELGADLFVCRLSDDEGNWINVATNSADEKQTPIFVWAMEDSLPNHPVMRAVHETRVFHVLSNNLRGMERGGESVDCMAYQQGFRSRLAFLLRGLECKAFGVIMLYSHKEGFFDRYETQFLADCSKIVSLTVGRQLELGRDALAKAAGGMAHVGNNVLGIMMNYNSLVLEELEYVIEDIKEALARPLPNVGTSPAELVSEVTRLRQLLTDLDIERKIVALHGVADSILRLKAVIQNLLASVRKPVIMPYIRGEEVLDLEPPNPLPL